MSQTELAGTPGTLAYPLDRDDPRVAAARSAERRAYEHFGLEAAEELVAVPDLETRIRVVEVGSGPPVVIIPGGVGYGVIWAPLLAELGGYTAYVMDRPGGGLSDGLDHRDYPMRTIAARSTAALYDHYDFGRAPLVGCSMGGLWSLRFALEHPDRASAISLLGCPGFYPGMNVPLAMRLMGLPGIGGFLVDRVMRASDADDARETWAWLGHPEATVERLPEALAEAWYRMEQLPHFRQSWVSTIQQCTRLRGAVPRVTFTPADLAAVAAPVALLWGREDLFGSVETGRAGAEHFQDAAFHEVGVGHLPWFDEPERCGELVGEFLARHG